MLVDGVQKNKMNIVNIFRTRCLWLVTLFFAGIIGAQEQPAMSNVSLQEYQIKQLQRVFVHKFGAEKIDALLKLENPPLVKRLKNAASIIGLSTLAAIMYGISHDMVTAHVNIGYFNSSKHDTHYEAMQDFIKNPLLKAIFGNPTNPEDIKNPVVIALFWGIIATWWMGAGLGVGVAACSQLGSRWLPMTASELVKPGAVVLGATLMGALISGLGDYLMACGGHMGYGDDDEGFCVKNDDELLFNAVGAAHNAAYLVAAVGGLLLMPLIIYKRFKKNKLHRIVCELHQEILSCKTPREYRDIKKKIQTLRGV